MNEVKLLDFWAQWCDPCRLMHPIIEDLAKTYSVEQIDVDENVDLAKQYGIRSIPTFVILRDGEEVERIVGAVTKEKLIELMESYSD